MNLHHDHARQFLANIELMNADDRRTSFANAVIETGGTFPVHWDTGQSGTVTVQLYEVTGQGFGIDDAISDWTRRAYAHLNSLEGDGFITLTTGVA
jgi:hypothetical protein